VVGCRIHEIGERTTNYHGMCNVEGRVIFYGDAVTDSMRLAIEETDSMRLAIEETERRRTIQGEYNKAHGITPASVKKGIPTLEYAVADLDYVQLELAAESVDHYGDGAEQTKDQLIKQLEAEMKAAAKELAFEQAAEIRNRIRALKLKDLEVKS